MRKNLYLLLILLSISFNSLTAQTLTYALEWNATENYYEIWATPNFSPNELVHNTAGSRISIAVPALDTPRTFTHTSPSGINYTAEFFSIHKPGAAPSQEFFSWADISGGTSVKTPFFTDGVPVLLLTFTLSDGKNDCITLWDNTTDPEPGDADMAFRQFDNNFTTQAFPTFVGVERYAGNTDSTTFIYNCTTLNSNTINDFVTLILYPNPVMDKIYIKGLIEKSTISIFDLKGRLVKKETEYLDAAIDVSRLESAMYLVRIENRQGLITKQLVKH
ncbi:MAG: T9SS type A sorting domain-containing protein [Algibacter sp.]|uniref:T9SS type A sorting domain-containing protein n=1 Tax=Algibacter sp. TaxID=1872428 RepID=UPI0026335976|nr:T9SS type A sorting domain-containing protein [Algibacter sp.]MDG1731092.1 T9SS type A sorting domain-containing protein [Algibacter sp.]MDG2179599.1 T9SS type A sorting domain-containing protein [Algibacter sp.]